MDERRFQFSIGRMLLAILVLCVGLGLPMPRNSFTLAVLGLGFGSVLVGLSIGILLRRPLQGVSWGLKAFYMCMIGVAIFAVVITLFPSLQQLLAPN